MPDFKVLRRDRTPFQRHEWLPPIFDGYPYLISRIGQSDLRHVALVPTGSRERIVALARAQAEANRLETAACFSPDDAIYVDPVTGRTWTGPTPTGSLVSNRLRLAENLPETADLAARRAKLEAFERSQQQSGFVIGDGTSRGRRATAAERARLAGRGPDGLPTGLDRCLTCGKAAGDYLRGGIELVRVHCNCDNNNLCARCRTPLAGRRLSAWFWDDDDDQAAPAERMPPPAQRS